MSKRPIDRFLNGIETAGNKLPDPAILFVIALVLVWILSALLSPIAFTEGVHAVSRATHRSSADGQPAV